MRVVKYEFGTCKDGLLQKDLLVKAATIKRFKYSPLGEGFKKQANVIKKQTEAIKKKKTEEIIS